MYIAIRGKSMCEMKQHHMEALQNTDVAFQLKTLNMLKCKEISLKGMQALCKNHKAMNSVKSLFIK